MKVKDILETVEEEIDKEALDSVKGKLKRYIKDVKSCRKTLKDLETRLDTLLKTDVDDIEEEFDY